MYILYCIPDSRISFRGSTSRRTGSMWLQNVACVGTEMRLTDCPADPADGQPQCSHHYQDARVHCQTLGQFIIMYTEVVFSDLVWVWTSYMTLHLDSIALIGNTFFTSILGGWGMECVWCKQLPYWRVQRAQ